MSFNPKMPNINVSRYLPTTLSYFLGANEIKQFISNGLEMYIVEYNRRIRDTAHTTRSNDRSTHLFTTFRKLLK